MEYPLADVLSMYDLSDGSEADHTWFYLGELTDTDLSETIRDLYSGVREEKYTYEYSGNGPTARLVKFIPRSRTFILNDDHDVVRAYRGSDQSSLLLEDLATAEAILEVYLREIDIPSRIVGEVLEKRDRLLRSLARDHMTSTVSISQALLDASNQDNDLEIALVAAARAIGFVTKHLGGGNEPDGIATLNDYPEGKKTIVLEAKSSNSTPTIPNIDIGTLAKHMHQFGADGCLLVAPAFPGSTRANEAAIADLARENRISCWTVKQLADVVSATQSRHISARKTFKIILESFAPLDVTSAIENLLEEPVWTRQCLYSAILVTLGELSEIVTDVRPTADMIYGNLINKSEYIGVTKEDVLKGLEALASSSKGTMTLRDDNVILHTSVPEIRRRTASITGDIGAPRRHGLFRDLEAQ